MTKAEKYIDELVQLVHERVEAASWALLDDMLVTSQDDELTDILKAHLINGLMDKL